MHAFYDVILRNERGIRLASAKEIERAVKPEQSYMLRSSELAEYRGLFECSGINGIGRAGFSSHSMPALSVY